MKIIESVKVILEDPGHTVATQVIAKVTDGTSFDEVDLTALALVHFPLDIHIDGNGATVTLKMRVSELELHGFAVKVEEPVDGKAAKEFVKCELQLQVANGTPSEHEFELRCICGPKETITVPYITDLYRVLNEKGYGLIPTQHGRIVQVVCPDCRSAHK